MKVTFIGHAAILIETKALVILSDPWWGQPCFGIQWWNYPPAATSSVLDRKIDYIYISHGHADHLHPGTLARLPKASTVLIPAGTDMAAPIRKAGFRAIIEVPSDARYELGSGVHCMIMPTCNDDSLMVVSDGERTCINLNDALHAAPRVVQERFAKKLTALYPTIDYFFCGYGTASHFPNCYRIPEKDPVATAARRQKYFNGQWAWLVAHLQPRFAFPFAADVVFLEEELRWANTVVHNGQRPTAALRALYPQYAGQAFDAAPGFQIEDDHVIANVFHQPLDPSRLEADLHEAIQRCNTHPAPAEVTLESTFELLDKNVELCRDYLADCQDDYLFVIRLRGTPEGYAIRKVGATIEGMRIPDSAELITQAQLVMTIRVEYLRLALSAEYGNESIFVGSGALFDLATRSVAERNLQRELAVLLRKHDRQLQRRPKDGPFIKRALKRMVKRVLGIREAEDLYDLGRWTEWEQPHEGDARSPRSGLGSA